MRRSRNAKIVATLGPASSEPEVIRRLFLAGADVFRLNFSHGVAQDHRRRFDLLRQLEQQTQRPIGIMADLQGPKLRVGTFAGGPVTLQAGAAFRLDLDRAPGDGRRASLPHRKSSRRSSPATNCCSTTASCASRWKTAATASSRPACWWAACSPSARA